MKIRIIIGAGQIGLHGSGITMVTTLANAKKMFAVQPGSFRVGDPGSAAIYHFVNNHLPSKCRGCLASYYGTAVQIDRIK